jgi:hypothetical protein
MTMKDYVLGTEEYLIRSQDIITSLLYLFYVPTSTPSHSPDPGHPAPMDAGIAAPGFGALDDHTVIKDRDMGYICLFIFSIK